LFLFVLCFFSFSLSQNCLILVPANPLTPGGLASPYKLLAPCNQSDPMMASFVQGAIFDIIRGVLAVYNPLVVTDGTIPAVPPPVPAVPASYVTGLWFGTNAGTLTLVDTLGSLVQGNCVNGLPNSIFGQFAYCNAPAFFNAALGAIANGLLVVPPLGNANDGLPCPTTRDFFVVDMDQSDNVVTSYLDVGNSMAQDTMGNRLLFAGKIVQTLTNGSDMRLLSIAMDSALGCTPFRVTDLADPLNTVGLPSFPTAELQAGVWQQAPVALVPITHAMTRVNNQPSLDKVNAYRIACGQPMAATVAQADSFQYCFNLYYVGPKRLAANLNSFSNLGSPDPNAATNLFAFLVQRYAMSFGADGLNCASLLQVPTPVIPIKNMGGQFVGGTIIVPVQPTGSQVTPIGGVAPVVATGTPQSTIIIIVVCTLIGGLSLIGLIIGVIWYRRRSLYYS